MEKISRKKTLLMILVFLLLFVGGEILSSLLTGFVFSFASFKSGEVNRMVEDIVQLLITGFLFWIFASKVFRCNFADFGITAKIKWWAPVFALLLPAGVIAAYVLIGKFSVAGYPAAKTILLIVMSLVAGLKAGILEEMLFRGFIMKLLEMRWNKILTVILPSFLFSLLHIPGMKTFSFAGILMLILSGTLVGIMFSLLAYRGNSIANSVLVHGVWNASLIYGIFHISPDAASYESVFRILLPTKNLLLSGGDFGIEASLICLAAYAIVALLNLRGLSVPSSAQSENVR